MAVKTNEQLHAMQHQIEGGRQTKSASTKSASSST